MTINFQTIASSPIIGLTLLFSDSGGYWLLDLCCLRNQSADHSVRQRVSTIKSKIALGLGVDESENNLLCEASFPAEPTSQELRSLEWANHAMRQGNNRKTRVAERVLSQTLSDLKSRACVELDVGAAIAS